MKLFYRWLNLVAFIAVVGMNWAAVTLPLFGRSTESISDSYPVAITPAGYAFSIWSVIYLLLAGFIVMQFLPSRASHPEFARIGPWFLISSALNVSWLLLWHSLYITATAFVMIALLISLIIAYRKSRLVSEHPDIWSLVFIALPFSIYLGWISVATIVNISVALYNGGWNGWGIAPQTWSIILILIAALLAFVVGSKYRDPFYALVIAWAAIAIAIKQADLYPQLAYTAWAISLILFIYAIYLLSLRTVREQRRLVGFAPKK